MDGYNLSYLKPGAAQAAVSVDEYAAPLVAFWQRGAGHVAAISFPLGGDYSQRVRAWPKYGDLCQSMGRWLMGESVPPGIGIRTHLDGNQLTAELFHEPDWAERIASSPPRLTLTGKSASSPREVVWERMQPGKYRAMVNIEGQDNVRGAVRVGDAALPFGPISATIDPEWSFDRSRLDELKALSAATSGTERVDLSDVWHAPRAEIWAPLTRWLLVALLLALLWEAWRTRIGAL